MGLKVDIHNYCSFKHRSPDEGYRNREIANSIGWWAARVLLNKYNNEPVTLVTVDRSSMILAATTALNYPQADIESVGNKHSKKVFDFTLTPGETLVMVDDFVTSEVRAGQFARRACGRKLDLLITAAGVGYDYSSGVRDRLMQVTEDLVVLDELPEVEACDPCA